TASNVIHLHDSVIVGGRGNRIGHAGAIGYETGHFIGGGVDNFISYEISYSTIAGGLENVAAGETTFIGGGAFNLVDWHGGGIGETIAGGEYNYITGALGYGTIAGGLSNSVLNDWAAIGGGENNTAAGPYSVVPGGLNNSAAGFSSFAAGHRAHADHWGTFVWADSSDSDFNSSGEDQFLIRATGGVGINATNPLVDLDVRGRSSVGSAFDPSTNTAGNVLNLQVGANSNGSANGISFYEDATGTGMKLGYDGSLMDDNNKLVMYGTGSEPRFVFENGGNLGLGVVNPSAPIQHASGASLSAGGVWQNASDVHRKTDFRPVNAAAVLDQLLALPLSSWRYKTEPAGVRHLGPTAQDFKEIFGLGEDDRSIGTVDIDGVALAAIQGMAEKLKQRDQEILELKQAVAELRGLLLARPAEQK
ncbi:MAG TPA: tail fiber domain-containing protein, partial [Clostridia bacterium]|nr:tail fiber domain-containing protein [Clostridia bacterium]